MRLSKNAFYDYNGSLTNRLTTEDKMNRRLRKELNDIRQERIKILIGPMLELDYVYIEAFIYLRKQFDKIIDDIEHFDLDGLETIGNKMEALTRKISKCLYCDESGWAGIQSLLMSTYSIAKANKLSISEREQAIIDVFKTLKIEVIK